MKLTINYCLYKMDSIQRQAGFWMTIHVIKITVYAVNTASFKCGLKFKEPYLCFVVFRQYKHQVRNKLPKHY